MGSYTQIHYNIIAYQLSIEAQSLNGHARVKIQFARCVHGEFFSPQLYAQFDFFVNMCYSGIKKAPRCGVRLLSDSGFSAAIGEKRV